MSTDRAGTRRHARSADGFAATGVGRGAKHGHRPDRLRRRPGRSCSRRVPDPLGDVSERADAAGTEERERLFGVEGLLCLAVLVEENRKGMVVAAVAATGGLDALEDAEAWIR